MQNFRLLFFIETERSYQAFEGITTNCDNEIHKQTIVEHYRQILHNNNETMKSLYNNFIKI